MDKTVTKEQLFYENKLLKKRIAELENSNPELIDKELRVSEEKFRDIFELSPLGKSLTSADGSLRINAAFSDMLGYSIDKLKSIHWKEITHPDDIQKSKDILQELIQGNKTNAQFEKRYIHKNGNVVWTESIILIKRDKNKKFEYFLTTAKDITEHKLAENALKSSEERLKIVFESAPDAYYLSDLKGKFLDGNKAAEELIGYNKEELIGKSIFKLNLVSAKQLPNVTKAIARSLMGKKSGPDEFILKRKDGSKVHAEISTFPVKISSKTVVLGIARDSTQRKYAEKVLRENEEKLRLVIDSSPIGVSTTDLKGYFVDVNPALCKMTGYLQKEMLGNHFNAFTHPDDIAKNAELFNKLVKGEISNFEIEKRYIHKNKSIVHFLIKAQLICDSFGKPLFQTAFIEDITERKIAEMALRESEISYRNLFDSVNEAIYVQDKQGKFIDVNEGVVQMYGHPKEYLIGKTPEIISAPEKNDILAVNQAIEKAFQGEHQQFEFWGIRANGEVFPKDVRLSKGRYFGKDVVFALAVDITERKRASQIQEVLYKISNTVTTTNNLNHLIGQIQKELGTIIDTTNFFVALYQQETDTLSLPFISDEKDNQIEIPKGKTLTKLVFDTNTSLLATVKDKRKLVEEGKIDHFGTLSKIWLGVPLHIDGKVIGVLAVQSYSNEKAFNEYDMKMLEFVSDQISLTIHRKQTEEELIEALEKATESDRLKSAFLANMSHEIRTPMNGILGFSDLLKEPGLTGSQQQQYIEVIQKSGDRMLNTINDIVDFSKIEAGQMSLTIDSLNVSQKMQFLHTFFKPEAEKKGIQLTTTCAADLQHTLLETDREKLHAILSNLIKNAIKYTSKGSIDFGFVSKKSKSESIAQTVKEPDELLFYVKDTGMGIAKERQKAIFERFVQADIEDRQALQGSGLGLSISKAFVEMLGGKIWVESEPEKGSTFYFTIAYKAFKANSKPVLKRNGKSVSFMQKTVLIVEDVEVSYHLIKMVVEKVGIKTIWAKHGKEAIECCEENPEIDLVLMDISMPVMNGYKATKEILKSNPNLPIIAQTAYAINGDREKSIAAGCIDYVTKPIRKDELLEVVGKYI